MMSYTRLNEMQVTAVRTDVGYWTFAEIDYQKKTLAILRKGLDGN